ncbi:uncharacterized protein EI90DRAFT_3044752 [Cantharellus anzutake]|uniref:uncharacterized protein n=1 Tax=Cantharellus anzutake TaxID=1750568 RepID=UPI0019065734|nr:uncharacterized protein EI90DRAFT_3044752 [Cantharellus anzutake]KAF8337062.1 hypothetical protein EI90DRAFT_3044752 [Cantharellus anzutake]
MKAFYAKMRPKCQSEYQVWKLFSQLHPSRRAESYHSHARRNLEVKIIGPTNHEGSVGDNEEDREIPTPQRTRHGRKSPSHEGGRPDDWVRKNQLSTRDNRLDTEGRSRSQPGFSKDEWAAAIQWVVTRGNPSHNELEWIGLYYAQYDFFQGIERQFTRYDRRYLC